MTQALVNNLNITSDASTTVQQKADKIVNFDKLLQKQNELSKHLNTTPAQIQNLQNQKKLDDTKDKQNNTLNDFKNFLKETTKEIVEESALEIGLIESVDTLADNILSEYENPLENETDVSDIITQNNSNLINNTISQIITNQSELYQNSETTNNSEDNNLRVTINGKNIENFFDDLGLITAEEEENPLITNYTNENDIQGNKLQDIIEDEILHDLNIEKIETSLDSNDNAESDLMQNQTPQEQGVKALIQSDIRFKDIPTDNIMKTQAANSNKPTHSNENIIEQISKQLSGLHNNSKVNIVLNPESLGKVSLQIMNSSEGLSAQLTVASQEVRDLIMKGLDGLKESLLAQGINVDNVSVKLNDLQKSEYNQDWTEQESSHGGYKQQKEQQKEKEKNFEQTMFSLNNQENGNV